MVTEEEIKKLAYYIWEAEGCPEGKHLEHYFCARQMLEEQETVHSYFNKRRIHPASLPLRGKLPQIERYW